MEVKVVSFEEILPLRMSVLRPGRPVEEGYFAGDKDDSTFHLGAYQNNKLLSVASFYVESYEGYTGTGYRLRSMATIPGLQGKGFGKEIMLFGYEELKRREVSYLWCNARISAIGFYEKLGMEVISEQFDIPVIGPHKVMIIKFSNDA